MKISFVSTILLIRGITAVTLSEATKAKTLPYSILIETFVDVSLITTIVVSTIAFFHGPRQDHLRHAGRLALWGLPTALQTWYAYLNLYRTCLEWYICDLPVTNSSKGPGDEPCWACCVYIDPEDDVLNDDDL
ncbi:hypothetical protein LB507_005488 [Fusarium sp. FIESC RH6]|nr:hypothetical protein LB507_005488 [Fusarium sp. FIESC RH6]